MARWAADLAVGHDFAGSSSHHGEHRACAPSSLFREFGVNVGNLLGAALVASEAGAIVSTADGLPWQPAATSFLVAAPGLHAFVVPVLE